MPLSRLPLAVLSSVGIALAPEPARGSSIATAQAGARFGYAVSSAGDVNGDGFDDVLVGEPGHDGGVPDEGRALLFFGSAAGLETTPGWSALGGQAGANFGTSVAGAGDVNGDGFDDVIIGAPNHDRGLTSPRASVAGPVPGHDGRPGNEGQACVVLGSASGLANQPVFVLMGRERGEHFGIAVSSAGDVNGDGFDDVIVGASRTRGNLGGAYVFHGAASGVRLLPSRILVGDEPHARFGTAVSRAGDENLDGYDDVLVGAPDHSTGFGSSDGSAFLFRGSATGVEPAAAWTAYNFSYAVDFGAALSDGGDLNGDGAPDILFGDPSMNSNDTFPTRPEAGGVLAIGSGLFVLDNGPRPFGHSGASVAGGRDIDGDGRPDFVAGSPGGLGSIEGDTGPPSGPSFTFHNQGTQAGAGFGFSVAMADVNGDGFCDVVAGAPFFDDAFADEGRVIAYLGSAAGLSSTEHATLTAP